MDLRKYQKDVDGISISENDIQKMVAPVLTLNQSSNELCDRVRSAGMERREEDSEEIVRLCASCISCISMIASNYRISLNDVAKASLQMLNECHNLNDRWIIGKRL